MVTNKNRIMCEVIFINGEDEAKAARDKLKAAGFELMVSNHPDDVDECSDLTKFGMIWKDYDSNTNTHRAVREFGTAVDAVCFFCTDCIGFVDPQHVPTHYSDFGERSAAINALNAEVYVASPHHQN
jgi:hypothetical protein